MKKAVVFILSTNFAGSHYLSLMLGSHSRTRHIGEAHRIRRPLKKLESVCYACRHKTFCPVFSEISPRQADQIHDIIFSRTDPGVTALIDNSKMARGWAERFLSDDRFDRKYVHLIRDPRAFVRRWSLQPRLILHEFNRRWKVMSEFPGRGLGSFFASSCDLLTYDWLQQNRRISQFIEQHELPAQVVTYRDLATDPVAELQRLMPWIGLPFEPSQCDYWNVEHHGTQKTEYDWIKQEGTRHFDLRWQTELEPAMQTRIINNPDVHEYLRQRGLQVADDGLTQAQPAPENHPVALTESNEHASESHGNPSGSRFNNA